MKTYNAFYNSNYSNLNIFKFTFWQHSDLGFFTIFIFFFIFILLFFFLGVIFTRFIFFLQARKTRKL